MAEKRSSVFVIIALIIGAMGLGLGLGTISFVNFQVIEGPQGPEGPPGPPGSLGILVGVWENLSRNTGFAPFTSPSSWLIEVGDAQLYYSDYLYLGNNNTRFYLNTSGWYRVSIMAMLDYSGATGVMSINVYKDDTNIHIPFRSQDFNGPVYYQLSIHFYISSDGTNYYEFNVVGSFALDIFSTNQQYNQLAIEYLGA